MYQILKENWCEVLLCLVVYDDGHSLLHVPDDLLVTRKIKIDITVLLGCLHGYTKNK